MERDPGETVNEAGNPAFEDVLMRHRAWLREHAKRHGDDEALRMLDHVEKNPASNR